MSAVFGFVVDFICHAPGIKEVIKLAQDSLITAFTTGPIPNHIAFIMDGNRRYAKNHRMEIEGGHSAGAHTLVNIISLCLSLKIKEISVYAFSIENFSRTQEEVDTLFKLLRDRLRLVSDGETEDIMNVTDVRIRVIGNKPMIPEDVLKDLEEIEEKTKNFTRATLNICAPYTSRDEICHSLKEITNKASIGEISDPMKVDANIVSENFYYGPDSNPVDLLIRTSGHMRMSDYLCWQCNENSSIFFTDTLWPEFGKSELFQILINWSYNRFLKLNSDDKIKNYWKKVSLENLDPHPPLATVSKR